MNSIVIKNGLMAAGAAIILGLVVYLIDPKGELISGVSNLTVIKQNAGKGVPELVDQLLTLVNN